MERKRHQRIFAMMTVFAMLFCNNGSGAFTEGIPEGEQDQAQTLCGMEEHIHTEECYESVKVCGLNETKDKTEKRFNPFAVHKHGPECYNANGVLNCGIIEGTYYHTHNQYCFDEAGNLVCGLEEKIPHEHNDSCYETEKKLICDKKEEEGHKHSNACYKEYAELTCGKAEEAGHKHSDACYKEHTELTCGKTEEAGHKHSDACYKEHTELTCGKAEEAGHKHSDACYKEHTELTCGKNEDPGHQHSDACYSEHTELTCGKQEDPGHHHSEECYQDEQVLTCELPEDENHTHTEECYTTLHTLVCEEAEREGHTHSESCYTTTRELTCGEEEREGHTHSESCYTTTRELVCGMEEREGHTHSENCYTTTRELVCGTEEREGHTHGESCYTTTRELACGTEEREGHTHSESCYTTKRELICGKNESEGHQHTEACYTTETTLICTEPTTTHHHTGACRDTEGNLICGQLEIQKFVSSEDNWVEEVVAKGHHHSDACYEKQLICGKEEHVHSDECYPAAESTQEAQNGQAADDEGSSANEGTADEESGKAEGESTGDTEDPEEESTDKSTEKSTDQTGTESTDETGEELSNQVEEDPDAGSDMNPAGDETENSDEKSTEESDNPGKESTEISTEENEKTGEESDENLTEEEDGEGTEKEDGEEADEKDDDAGDEDSKEDSEKDDDAGDEDSKEDSEKDDDAGDEDSEEADEKDDDAGDEDSEEDGEKDDSAEDEDSEEDGEKDDSAEDGDDEEDGEATEEDKDTENSGDEEDADEEGGDGDNAEEDSNEEDSDEDADNEEDGEETDGEELTEEQGEITITAEDAPYAVSISFSGDAGIPEGTKLVVSEAGEETETRELPEVRYGAKGAPMKSAGLRSAEAPQERHASIPSMTVWNAGEAIPDIVLYQKTLDISLVSEGEEIEPDPAAQITVTVQLPGIEDGQAVEVRHITEGGTELLESTNNAGNITFTTNGFSLFEFTSKVQALSTRTTGQTTSTFYSKTANQSAQASAISVSNVAEGLEVLEAYSLTRSSDLWMVLQRIADIGLGKLESIVLYTVEDGQLGGIVRENLSLADVLRFNLGDLGGYALVKDTGLRHMITELDNITLDGMMPKNSVAEAADVTEEYSDSMDYEETVAAYDIAILNDGEEYQPEESPIKVSIHDDDITAALEEGKAVRLWHIMDDGSREEISYSMEEGAATFEAAGFSAYVFSASIEKIITIDGENWKVTVEYGKDAGIPEDAELEIHEVEAGDYQAAAAAAWNWTEKEYIFYTKFLDISIVKDGEVIEPLTPVSVSIQLLDVEAGAEALRVVHFGENGVEAIEGQAGADGTILFEADSFSVYGFGNALQPLTSTETEEADLTIYGFGGEAQLAATEAPEVAEGLEVLGAYTLSSGVNSTAETGEEGTEAEETGEEAATEEATCEEAPAEENPEVATGGDTGEERTEASGESGSSNNNLWIKAELKEGAELSEMESVALCTINGEKTNSMISELTTNGQIMKLETSNIAIIKDTGYRHLNFVLDPNGENQKPTEKKLEETKDENAKSAIEEAAGEESINEENGTEDEEENTEKNAEEETSSGRIIILDGMMPKDAEASTIDVTVSFAEHEYPVPEKETEEAEEEQQEETEEDNPEAEQGEEDDGEEAAEENTETKRTTLAAYEITILNNETEYQPDTKRPIQVEIIDSRITGNGYTELGHIKDDGTEEQITEYTSAEGKIEFTAYGFSVYAVVEGPQPVVNPSTAVNTLEDIVENQGYLFLIARNGTNYMTSNPVLEAGHYELQGSNKAADAETWYFESAGASGEFYIYCIKDSTNYYAYSPNDDNVILLDTDNKTLFTIEQTTNASGTFYIYHVPGTKNRAFSVRGNKNFFMEARNNGYNSNERVVLTKVIVPEDDPYELDGKKYGLLRYNTGISGRALTVNDSGNLDAREMLVKENPLNRKEYLYVAKDSNISMWQFNTEGTDLYTLSTDVNGSTKFLKINSNNISLVDTESAASRIQVIPGTGSNEGKVRLKDSSSGKTIYLNNNKFSVANDNAGNANQYMSFAILSELNEDDFVPYSAQKVSIAYQDQQVQNGDQIVIYTRRWNDTEKHYDFYVVDHNGDLVRAFEEGGSILWIGTKINTAVWDFTEYYWEGTDEPNYYYDLKNVYTNQFLSPQVSGQIFSGNPVGINLNGRRYNDYYSTILAWDDPTYAYAGIKTKDDSSSIESCRIGKAEDFYFAKVERQTTDTLTPVSTVDHTAYGITMKMVDFNNGTTSPQGTTTDTFQHQVIGDTNKFLDDFDGTKGLLSTNLNSNGYPIATRTQRSLGELFASAVPVNNLFLESTYYGSGYFSYDSAQNFASLKDDNTFIVYKEIGTDDSSSKPSLKHGNFYPYNDLTPGLFATKNPENLYTATKQELSEDNPRKHEKLYLVKNTDFYFGMEISASFVQTPNGKDAWNHDIIYEFIGDDDFWLYVDGELVVDLGGIHSALGAKVNYATGTVDVSSVEGPGTHTTIYEIFKENYKARNGVDDEDPGLQAYLSEKFTKKNGNWVFKDYSTHTMRIFYMERGAGASNLKMRFNLASVNPNQILLTKEVSGIADAEFLTTKFPYQIWYQPPHEDKYVTMEQGSHDVHGYRVTYKNTNEGVEFSPTYTIGNTTYENVFMLKPGQTVEINTPDEIGNYRIVECGVPGNIYNRYGNEGSYSYHAIVNDETIEGTVKGAEAGYPLLDYATSYAKVTERAQVVFTNHVNEDYLRTLSITKKLLAEDGTTELAETDDPTGFQYRLYLGEGLGYYNMGDYFVKSPDGTYCKFENGHFVSIGKSLFDELTDDEKERVTFTTSPTGSVDKIPAGYTVEIRDLPVGTKFKVEEMTTDLPEGYTLKQYERDPGNPYNYHGAVYNEGDIQEGNNARLFVVNQRGWGLTVKKVWTDKSFTLSHDPVYVAIYTGPEDSDLLTGSVREIRQPSTSVYYYIDELIAGKTFEDYIACEVALENPVTDGDGTVTGYTGIRRITEGVPVEIEATNLSGEAVSPTPKYLVIYDKGEAGGSTDSIHNVRTDTITNQREGGIILRLYDWLQDWDAQEPNKPKMLSGGVFTLEKGGEPVGEGTYTSDSRGLITILYDFENDTDYTLTQVSAPAGYQGLTKPLTFSIPTEKDRITITADSAIADWYKAQIIDQTSGDNLIAYVNLKNKPFTLRAVKIDPDPDDRKVLPGAHFALYRQYTSQGGNPVKDYYPISGYEDRISGLDGVVDGIDQTLEPWTYYLTETEAPTNYDKAEEDILFTISELGYVSTVPAGRLTEETLQDGTTEYTISIPNKKLVLIPPVLYVSKTVVGNDEDITKPFRFTVSGLIPNKEYVYQRFETESGTDYHEQSGAAALGFIKVNADGMISFDLMHYEKIGISLPYDSKDLTVSESLYTEYNTSYVKDEDQSRAGNSVLIEEFTKDVVIAFTNTYGSEVIVAPTSYSTRHTPYLLLMLSGFFLLTVVGGIGFIRRRKTGDGEDEPPDPSDPPRNSNSPPGGRKQFDAGGWTERRSGFRITEKRIGNKPKRARKEITDSLNLSTICGTPPCPQANLWTKTQGSPGMRGDPGG